MLKIKTSLRILGLAVIGAVATASQVHAQSVDVPFDGSVGNSCTFGAPVGGTLAPRANNKAMEASTGVAGLATPTGTAGSVSISCIFGGSLTVATPVGTAPAGYTPAVTQSVVELASDGSATSANTGGNFNAAWAAFPTAALAIPADTGTPETLNVGMVIGQNAGGGAATNIPPGLYNYSVTVTVTPN